MMHTLDQMILQNKIPHLLIFHGPKESKKEEVALQFARKILNSDKEEHVDLHHYFPEGKLGMHSLQAMNHLCQEIYLSSYAGGYKCYIIYEAERMLPSNANSLLKTFEEPPPKTVIFLLTGKLSMVLPTIRSRAQLFSFHANSSQEVIRSSMEQILLEILSHKKPFSELSTIIEELEKERKKGESEQLQGISKEIGASQKEMIKKGIEGRLALEYQQKANYLFEIILRFYRDLFFFHLKVDSKYFFYPDLITSYKTLSPRELESIERDIQKARLAHERGLKLQHCIEAII